MYLFSSSGPCTEQKESVYDTGKDKHHCCLVKDGCCTQQATPSR
jgi:hypothetical protein